MAKQAFDHSEFIQGQLEQCRTQPNVARADQRVLVQGPRMLILAQASHIEHSSSGRQVSMRLKKFRKRTNDGPFECEMDAGLNEEATAALWEYLQEQEILKDLPIGGRYIVAAGEGIDAEAAKAVLRLFSEGVLSVAQLDEIRAYAQHASYKSAVAELEQLIDEEGLESLYQSWLEEHPWVFGTHYVEQVDLDRVGFAEKPDICLMTADGYLDLFELKRPSTEVLAFDDGRGVWRWRHDASAAIGQCAKYMDEAEQHRWEMGRKHNVMIVKPRARVIMGRSQAWDQDQRDALRSLNSALHYIEIWTYDHVLAMARRLVAHYDPDTG